MKGTPCPICRDENLLLHETNVELLKQIIDPESEKILKNEKLQFCFVMYKYAAFCIERSWMNGYLKRKPLFKEFDYEELENDIDLEMQYLVQKQEIGLNSD